MAIGGYGITTDDELVVSWFVGDIDRPPWRSDSPVEGSYFGKFSVPDRPSVVLGLSIEAISGSSDHWSGRYSLVSNPMPIPLTDAAPQLITACQAQLLREEARLEAEAQAEVAAAELEALRQQRLTIAEAEVIKTQALEVQLQHQEVVADILREIVRIRLAGEEDRARITNEYLVRMEAEAAAFDVETAEIEARIQAYLDFNAELLTRIETYQAEVEQRLADAQTQIAEQVAELERIEQEARNTVVDETPQTP